MQALYFWFWRMLPANPLVVRIVQGGSRRMRHLWIRMGYLGALIGLVLVGLASGGGFGEDVMLSELAQAGSKVFFFVSYGQVILVCLLAPLFMAGAIGQERAGETFDILLTTPLSNFQIVLGSLVGRLFFVLALLLSGLPLFAVLLIFGGVPISSVFVAFAVAGFTTLLVGSVAVAMSVVRAGGRKAVFTFVILIAAYLVCAYVLDLALFRRVTAVPNSTTWLTPLHPLLVLESWVRRANYRPPDPEQLAGHAAVLRFYLGRPFAAFAMMSLLASGLLIVGSALAVRHIGQGEGLWSSLERRLRLRLSGAAALERRRPAREVWQNPIAWREANTRGNRVGAIFARLGFTAVAVLLGGLLLLLYHQDGLPRIPGTTGRPLPSHEVFRTVLLTLLVLEVAVVTLVAIFMSAGCVSREREDGTLDLILATPVTPKQYIWGKLRGLVSFLGMLIAAPVLTLLMVSVYTLIGGMLQWPQARATYNVMVGGRPGTGNFELMIVEAPLLLAVMLVPFVALCGAAGMSWSLKARTVLGAVVPTVAIVGVLALVLGLCGWQAKGIPVVGPLINAFSPATNVALLLNPWKHIDGFAEGWGFGRFWMVSAALYAAAGYSLVVYALIMGMVKGFDQTVRRLSGVG